MVSRISDVRGAVVTPKVTEPKQKLLPLKAQITLPPRLSHPPTAADLIITKTFDGLTPEAAAKQIKNAFRGTIAPENQRLVDTTVNERVRDLQVALNNVFTKGTPNQKFLASMQPAEVSVLASLSPSNRVVYKITRQNQEPQYFTKGWNGAMTPMAKPPVQVVAEARISLEPQGQRITYPQWENKGLSGPITTITEL
jgi:hypothetical protein